MGLCISLQCFLLYSYLLDITVLSENTEIDVYNDINDRHEKGKTFELTAF